METVAPTLPHEFLFGLTYQYAPIFMSILVSALLCLMALLCTRGLKKVPGRAQALMETIVTAFRDLVYSTMGPKDGRTYMPLIGTIFLYVFLCNMIGLIPTGEITHKLTHHTDLYFQTPIGTLTIPGFMEPTRNVNTPWGLGIMVFFIMHVAAIARKGPAHYFDEYFTPHMGRITWPLQKPAMRFLGAALLAVVWGALGWLIALSTGLSDQMFGVPVPEILDALGDKLASLVGTVAPFLNDAAGTASTAAADVEAARTFCTVPLVIGLIALVWCLIRLSHEPRKVGVPNILMFPLNVIGKLAEILSMSFRLFGNIFGGAVIIALLGGMTMQIGLPILLQAFMGIFVGTIQAFVFAMLALTYITVEISEDEVEETIEEGAPHHKTADAADPQTV